MTEYAVVWKIDIEADSPQEAAEQALEIQRRPDSIATVFEVSPLDPGRAFKVNLTEDTVEEI